MGPIESKSERFGNGWIEHQVLAEQYTKPGAVPIAGLVRLRFGGRHAVPPTGITAARLPYSGRMKAACTNPTSGGTVTTLLGGFVKIV